MSEPRDLGLTEPDDARIESILRSLTATDQTLDTPPDSVWEGIERALAAEQETPRPEDASVVVTLHSHRRRTAIVLGAVAAAVVLVVAVGAALLFADGSDDSYEVVGTADLVWTDGFDPAGVDATAEASLLGADGDRWVRLDAADLPTLDEPADLELWLIGFQGGEPAVIQPIALVDQPTDGEVFDVPSDFDPDAYDEVAVDISIEPRDGDAAHSGRSIVRGPLQA